MTDLGTRFLEHVRSAGLFPMPGRAVLAVSGGADSVALLDLVAEHHRQLGLEPSVGHVNHGIRADSDVIEDQARALADRYGLPWQCARLELGPDASETVARRARYAALRAMQCEAGAVYLLTGHHADDQVETVLFRVLRGSGVAGLGGVAPVGPGGLVRPLLPFTRAELEAWVHTRGLPIDDDPSNRDTRHDRSWLRTELLPMLRARLGADLDERFLALASDAARNRHAWSLALEACPGLVVAREAAAIEVARVALGRYHKVLSEALLRASARELGCRIGPRRAARLLRFAAEGQSGKAMELGGGWLAELTFDRVRIHRPDPPPTAAGAVRLSGSSGQLRFGSWAFSWRPDPAGAIERRGAATWVVPGELALRSWRPGDRMLPLGGAGRRKVRRLFMEARVPMYERRRYPLVVRDDQIVWVPGVCRSAGAVPTPGDQAVRIEARQLALGGGRNSGRRTAY
jgi:tRNA(Ile)-lysidine synthase